MPDAAMDAVHRAPASAADVAPAAEPSNAATRDIVVVGASAGGVNALRVLLTARRVEARARRTDRHVQSVCAAMSTAAIAFKA
ncbi:MAG TPA: hypothetical protein VFU71_11605, partial [Burkholderiaceae bacterium]|nr:hypothetical protein [Burkholderiaceae bacterium]